MDPDPAELRALLTLNALPQLGPIAANRLLGRFGSAGAVLAADRRSIDAVAGEQAAEAVVGAAGRFDADRELARVQAGGASFAPRGAAGYPPLLAQISDPPVGLYRRGPYRFDSPCVAVVGTRRGTDYGMAVARDLASQLARRGLCVVSGLSRGIDTAAHEGALEGGGITVAVLPGGIDVVHPAENLELYRRIAESGALVAELPYGRVPLPDTVDMRARVIAGICEAVVVVESDLRGGAIATARFAGEQGRLIFAVPGRIDRSMSSGCHQLIRDGATLVTQADDILSEMQFLGGRRQHGD